MDWFWTIVLSGLALFVVGMVWLTVKLCLLYRSEPDDKDWIGQ